MSMEGRSEVRQRVFLKGRITFNQGASSMDCVVRDFTLSGARLVLSETATLPAAFDLYIPQKGRTFRATMIWRRADGTGVVFADESVRPLSAASNTAELSQNEAAQAVLLRRLGELEAENAALRRMLADMAPQTV